ncbi:sigma-54-dependent Fis family transcriptional regulator [Intrasporangium calvum]|uniref:GAF modulated sigma54 specific transcriptional regulator, Fis family n=2 Tax=Intrasporangium calvum TaxID=53358 RepID=E6S7J2_INTC7|nr:helix-turn-helix domain-containing protein [Intrasporangium calvum]ADU46887.1 GAF modulated sigma54 specific transcriptional regulator, Fis family [Intrasporangium calvum DSM 43043]AXG12167.1 transcriptional regulator [Intrasporangium calvum]
MADSAMEVAREQYLAAQGRSSTVRPMVIASWQRSIGHQVNMTRLDAPFVEDPDLDTPLVKAASPILEALHEQLANEPVATMLTDKSGLVLERRVTHEGLTTRLNHVSLAPGHVYAEEFVGTNGIGTALASARPTVISGPEHYVEELRFFHCAAVPILHPTRRVALGAFNLTATVASGSGSMALALAASTARQIERELALISSQREYVLFERYLETCRAIRHTPVLAFNADVVMMNDRLRASITGGDQTALLSHAREIAQDGSLADGRTLILPSGLVVEIRRSPVGNDEAQEAGEVLQVRLVGRPRSSVRAHPPRRISGLVGSDPAWVKSVAEAEAAYRARSWICIFGEAGAGKVHLIGAIHRAHGGTPPLVLDPPVEESPETECAWVASLALSVTDPENVVIVRNAHWMSARLRTLVVDQLSLRSPANSARIVLTAQASAVAPEDELVTLCGTHIDIPPLRHRHDDVLALIRFFLRRYRPHEDLHLSPATEHALQRYPWPENVRQLEQTVRLLSRRHTKSTIEPTDLPPEFRVQGRSKLTTLEEVERDAILKGLVEHDRNVLQTARDLGISRATIYRKMRRYGIDTTRL